MIKKTVSKTTTKSKSTVQKKLSVKTTKTKNLKLEEKRKAAVKQLDKKNRKPRKPKKTKEELQAEIEADSKKTPEQLIIDNELFAYKVVNDEFKRYLNFSNLKEDLFSAAKMGLITAANKFKPDFKNKFISYAVHWIRYYVNEEIRKYYPVKLNQNHVYKRNKLLKAIAAYKADHKGKEPSDKWLMKELNISQKVLDGIRNVNGGKNFTFVSLQNTYDTEDGEETCENKVFAEIEKSTDPRAGIEAEDILNTLKTKVSERDFNIFVDIKKNGCSFKDIKDKYKLKFPSSAAYLVKRMEKLCREIAGYA